MPFLGGKWAMACESVLGNGHLPALLRRRRGGRGGGVFGNGVYFAGLEELRLYIACLNMQNGNGRPW